MRFLYKGDGSRDGEGEENPCAVFGHTFPIGEWVSVELPIGQAQKLAGNPMFETEGVAAPAGPVEIPDGWETLPFLTKRALAAKLQPLADGAKGPEVLSIIKAELAKRQGEPEPSQDA